jgi:DNA polymerase-3 subunit epsilon
VETANQSYASICQIGLAFVKAGEVVETWGTYVNPKENFTNTRIHGIDTSMVTGSPTFPSAWSQTLDLIDGFLVFHHTHFDRTALNQAVKKHGLKPPTIRFMDSANLARSANSKFAVRGYGLENLCSSYQIQYENAHNAVSDASMTAKVIHCLLQESSTKTSDWSELETDFFGNTARSNKRSRSRQDPYSERKTDLTYEVDLREILGSAPSIKEMAAKKENKGRDHNSQSTTKLEYGKIALIAFVILVADFVLFGALDNPSEGFQNVIIFILLVSIGVFIWSFRKWRKSRLLKK